MFEDSMFDFLDDDREFDLMTCGIANYEEDDNEFSDCADAYEME